MFDSGRVFLAQARAFSFTLFRHLGAQTSGGGEKV